jgi:hypothetical protein
MMKIKKEEFYVDIKLPRSFAPIYDTFLMDEHTFICDCKHFEIRRKLHRSEQDHKFTDILWLRLLISSITLRD